MVVSELRRACAQVAEQATQVQIHTAAIPAYAASLSTPAPAPSSPVMDVGARREVAAHWLSLDAINFGSGWFPTLSKAPGSTGYQTVSGGWRRHCDADGVPDADRLQAIDAGAIAAILGQDPGHELMGLFAASLNDLGARLATEHGGDPLALIDSAAGSALALVETLAGWACFSDVSCYGALEVPFLKRAQIAAADLSRAGAASFGDLDHLTMFADNLVPHVLRLDGILSFDPALVARIEAGELITHGTAEEIEIRACAVRAVELIVAALAPGPSAAQVDELLWQRGQGPRYKSTPRHRSRCTAY